MRSASFALVRAESEEGDGLTMEGYAAVFDSPTLIDSWEGLFVETIARGAFKKTLRERTPVLQFDHGQHPLVGSLPIGVIQSAAEDERGVRVEARLADNWLVQPVRDAIASGAVNGMSYRFDVVREKWDYDTPDKVPVRTVLELRCAELGPVVFPAYTDTEVGVRSREIITALSDPRVRADVARAALAAPDSSSSAPATGHPDEATAAPPSPARDAGISDAPTGPGHPSTTDLFRAEAALLLARMSSAIDG